MYQLPKLDYSYDALEPHFDALTMEIHYSRHHQAYINNANGVFEANPELPQSLTPVELLKSLSKLPSAVQGPLRNNVGGHVNHSFFWTLLKSNVAMNEALEQLLVTSFGSVDNFKAEFEKAATTRFGSGWAWLVVTADKKLAVVSTANQDNPENSPEFGGFNAKPILGLDVWEHAYYLKYQNKRPDFIKSFWSIVDWNKVYDNYLAAI